MKITLATHRFLAYFDSFVKTGNDVWNRVFGRKMLRDITHVMRQTILGLVATLTDQELVYYQYDRWRAQDTYWGFTNGLLCA